MHEVLSQRRIDRMRRAYVEDAASVEDIAAQFGVSVATVRELADAGSWDSERLRVLCDRASQAAMSDAPEQAALLRRAALIVAHRVLAKAGALLDAPCSASDVRSVATAAETADRVARREIGLAVERSEHDVAVGQRKERDMWAVIASVPQDGGDVGGGGGQGA